MSQTTGACLVIVIGLFCGLQGEKFFESIEFGALRKFCVEFCG